MITIGIPCCLLYGQRAGDVQRHDNIDLKVDKLGRERRKSIRFSFRRAKLKCNVLSLDKAEFTQSFPKISLERIRVRISQVKCAHPNRPILLPVKW